MDAHPDRVVVIVVSNTTLSSGKKVPSVTAFID